MSISGDREAHLNVTSSDAIQQHPNLTPETIEAIRLQESYLILPNLSNELLLQFGLALLKAVQDLSDDERKPVTIDIEVNDRCIFHYAMPGTSKDNDWWIERKKRTVKHFERSSYYIGRSLHSTGKSWTAKYAGLPEGDFAAHGGCFPIRTTSGGPLVGTVTMSGLAQVLDHILITRVWMEQLRKG